MGLTLPTQTAARAPGCLGSWGCSEDAAGAALRDWERPSSTEPAWPVQRATEQETKSVLERRHWPQQQMRKSSSAFSSEAAVGVISGV